MRIEICIQYKLVPYPIRMRVHIEEGLEATAVAPVGSLNRRGHVQLVRQGLGGLPQQVFGPDGRIVLGSSAVRPIRVLVLNGREDLVQVEVVGVPDECPEVSVACGGTEAGAELRVRKIDVRLVFRQTYQNLKKSKTKRVKNPDSHAHTLQLLLPGNSQPWPFSASGWQGPFQSRLG